MSDALFFFALLFGVFAAILVHSAFKDRRPAYFIPAALCLCACFALGFGASAP